MPADIDSGQPAPLQRGELWSLVGHHGERLAVMGERVRDLEGDRDEMKSELKEIRSLASQIRGGVIVLGVLWAFATFVVPLLLHR